MKNHNYTTIVYILRMSLFGDKDDLLPTHLPFRHNTLRSNRKSASQYSLNTCISSNNFLPPLMCGRNDARFDRGEII